MHNSPVPFSSYNPGGSIQGIRSFDIDTRKGFPVGCSIKTRGSMKTSIGFHGRSQSKMNN